MMRVIIAQKERTVRYRFLGNTGVKVSELCFGTMSFGATADEAASAEMFNACLDAGINHFDCANMYAQGRSEEILGRLMQAQRQRLIITSKVFFPVSEEVNDCGLSRRHIRQACEASLKRLNTDYIDIYYLHRFDERTALEETLRAIDDLVSEGKILYPALSNFAAWQCAKTLGIAQRLGYAAPVCIQPMYSLLKRQAEVELFPMAQSESLGVFPYSPLAAGLLTGKYSGGAAPTQGRIVESKQYLARYSDAANMEIAGQFSALAKSLGHHPASLAVAWAGSHPAVTAPIIGARHLEQLKPSLDAVNIQMTPELRAQISALSHTPAPATDRAEEGGEFHHGAR